MHLINLNDYTYFTNISEVLDILTSLGIQTVRTIFDANESNACDEVKLEYIAWIPDGTTLDTMQSKLAQELPQTIGQKLEEKELMDGLRVRDHEAEHLGFTFYLVIGMLHAQIVFNDKDFGVPPVPEPLQIIATVTMRIYASELIARKNVN